MRELSDSIELHDRRMERLVNVPNRPVRFGSIEAMRNPVELEALLGKVDEVRRAPFATGGYSGSVHERWTVERDGGEPLRLVLKITKPAEDWTAFRTGDTSGREALLLGAPELDEVWSVFHCCYRGYATKGGEVALLMDDLGEHLFPDEDKPISVADEDTLLGALAAMHARFWKSDALELAWLNTPEQFLGVLGPDSGVPFALSGMVREGWRSALSRLPSAVVTLLRTPPDVLARTWCEGLPFTLLHGDAKVANFAVLPGDRCAAVDWALVGAGPATVDLGWYLAVNAGRLAHPKGEVIARYRSLLESRLGHELAAGEWERMLNFGLLCGAMMLLWSKASSLESGSAKAAAEWEWWVSQLERLARVSSTGSLNGGG